MVFSFYFVAMEFDHHGLMVCTPPLGQELSMCTFLAQRVFDLLPWDWASWAYCLFVYTPPLGQEFTMCIFVAQRVCFC